MKLADEVRGVAEVLGRRMSDVALAVLVRELRKHDPQAVSHALRRCVREAPRVFTYAEIVSRMPGAAPSPDEAWAIASQAYREANTLVWTDEICEAFGTVSHMSDRVAARMAFRETYQRLSAQGPVCPKWWVSPGSDASRRAPAIKEAEAAGRLPSGEAKRLGYGDSRALTSGSPAHQLTSEVGKRMELEPAPPPADWREQIEGKS